MLLGNHFYNLEMFEELPEEMVLLILSFNPGLDVGLFCRVSKRYNKITRLLQRRMYLIEKVRQGFINNRK